MAAKLIGVLALQGAFAEHIAALKKCGAETFEVRTAEDLNKIDGLIIPGGESTTIGKLMNKYAMEEVIKARVAEGMPLWGTCAGMILMAKEIVDSDQIKLGLMDIEVKRNAYGRQVDSFEAELQLAGIGQIKGVFIRAPYVGRVWGEARVLSCHNEQIVMVQQRKMLATSFHPELTEDLDIHQYFLEMG